MTHDEEIIKDLMEVLDPVQDPECEHGYLVACPNVVCNKKKEKEILDFVRKSLKQAREDQDRVWREKIRKRREETEYMQDSDILDDLLNN